MIEINISDFEKESMNYINMLTDNKGQEIRQEMIKFLKEGYWPDSTEYCLILEFINDFFIAELKGEFLDQPERSKREDRKLCDICCVNYKDINCECGALNSMET